MRESAAGASKAPKAPWRARAPKRRAWVEAMPPSAEAPAKPKRPMMKIFLRPTKSAIRPPRSNKLPNAREYAVTTHWRLALEMCSAFWALGRAMLTMEASRTTINEAMAMTSKARQRFGSNPVSISVLAVSVLAVSVLAVSVMRGTPYFSPWCEVKVIKK